MISFGINAAGLDARKPTMNFAIQKATQRLQSLGQTVANRLRGFDSAATQEATKSSSINAPRPTPAAASCSPADEAAIVAIRSGLASDPNTKLHIVNWIGFIAAQQQSGKKLNVLEHTALMFFLRSNLFEEQPLIQKNLQDILRNSWKDLTGLPVNNEQLTERLPNHVLKNATRTQRAFHLSAFYENKPGGFKAAVAFGKDYIPEGKDAAMAISALAFALMTPSVPLNFIASTLLGFVAGSGVGSTSESYIHKLIGHARENKATWLEKAKNWGPFGKMLENTNFGHEIVHHGLTYTTSYVRQFDSTVQKDRVDSILKTMGPAGDAHIKRRYGLETSRGLLGFFWYVAPPTPIYLAMAWALGMGPAACTGLAAGALLAPAATLYLHSYLHLSHQEAQQQAGPLMRWLLRTRCAQMIWRQHYVHHSRTGGGNYSLLHVGDRLLGEYDPPTLKEMVAMHEIGI